MTTLYDVIIVGSGPAGVSAAFPLVEKGLKVLMLDGGMQPDKPMLSDNFLAARAHESQQWQWMLGNHFYSLRMQDAISPKLRVPHLGYVFDQFAQANQIHADKFVAIGSLASGGLSNAWGAGVARFSQKELSQFPVPIAAWDKHYRSVAQRMGISGKNEDDLSDYFGLDDIAQPAIAMDNINTDFFTKYESKKSTFTKSNVRVGRPRIAVLSQPQGDRQACSLSGNCLWGCAKRSIYSASEDLIRLKQFANFELISGMIVTELANTNQQWHVFAKDVKQQTTNTFIAKKIMLAAGTLASTGLALQYLQHKEPVRLLSSPTAAFLVWNYKRFGTPRTSGFGLGQLSYHVKINDELSAFGSTFSTNGIPIAEFAKQVPLSRFIAIDVLSALLSSCAVGNVFLPGHLTQAAVQLQDSGALAVTGAYKDDVDTHMNVVASEIKRAFLAMGGLVLPGSFTLGKPGGDIHYAGTLPLTEKPKIGQSTPDGELFGAEGLYIVDGASLPILPEKSHTLTIMANAERIAEKMALQ